VSEVKSAFNFVKTSTGTPLSDAILFPFVYNLTRDTKAHAQSQTTKGKITKLGKSNKGGPPRTQ
jgi:hypothetical protein